MLSVALEYPPGDCNCFRVYRTARGGRACEHVCGYKTLNRIPLPFTSVLSLLRTIETPV